MENEKIFFMPGDIVTLKQDIPDKPIMIVIGKATSFFKDEEKNYFKGIKCRWFTTTHELQEGVFNTKDLIKL